MTSPDVTRVSGSGNHADLIAELEARSKPGTNGWKRMVCPLHGTTDRNLAWTIEGGEVKTACHSHACDRYDVVEAMGFDRMAVYAEPRRRTNGAASGPVPPKVHDSEATTPTPRRAAGGTKCWYSHEYVGRTPAVVYDCTMPDGDKLQHQRYEWPEHDGCDTKKVTWSPTGHDSRVNARHYLPRPLTDGSPHPLFLTEGEKVADALAAAGHEAIGLAGGADHPPDADELRSIIRGRNDIIVAPDLDAAGFAFARQVGEALRSMPEVDRLRFVEPDRAWGPKADLADVAWPEADAVKLHGWASGTAPDAEAVKEARQRVDVIRQLLTEVIPHEDDLLFNSATDVYRDTPDPVWAAKGIAIYGAITQLGAEPKVGKTILVLHLTKSGLLGGDFLGEPVDVEVVVYLTEQVRTSWKEQMSMVGLGNHVPGLDVVYLHDMVGTPWEEIVATVERRIKRRYEGKKVMLVIDTMTKWAGIEEEQDQHDWEVAFKPVTALTEELNTATVVARHAKKASAEMSPSEALRGSNAGAGASDINFLLAKPSVPTAEARRTRVFRGEGRFGAVPEAITIEWTDDGYVVLSEDEVGEEGRAMKDILRVLGERPDQTVVQLAEAVSASKSVTDRALDKLTSASNMRVERHGEGVPYHPYLYRLTLPNGSSSQPSGESRPEPGAEHTADPLVRVETPVSPSNGVKAREMTSPFGMYSDSSQRVGGVSEGASDLCECGSPMVRFKKGEEAKCGNPKKHVVWEATA